MEKTGPVISIKVTESLKALYDDLSQEQKKHLKQRIVEDIERAVHDSRFRPGMYSSDDVRE